MRHVCRIWRRKIEVVELLGRPTLRSRRWDQVLTRWINEIRLKSSDQTVRKTVSMYEYVGASRDVPALLINCQFLLYVES
jgi:hypothetical protein